MNLIVVGTSRCDVLARAPAGERNRWTRLSPRGPLRSRKAGRRGAPSLPDSCCQHEMLESRNFAMKREGGFSLIELLCAILIIGISLVGLAQGIVTALRSSKESELQTAAALIAAGRIELVRAEGFLMEGEDEGECGEGLSLYQWKQSITATDTDGLYDVKVAVENTQTGKPIYTLQTLLFDPPYSTDMETSDDSNRSSRSNDNRRRSLQ